MGFDLNKISARKKYRYLEIDLSIKGQQFFGEKYLEIAKVHSIAGDLKVNELDLSFGEIALGSVFEEIALEKLRNFQSVAV